MQGRDPMKGRHFVGGRTGSAGKMRGGQSEPQGNRPITGTNTAMKSKPPTLSTPNTSANAMSQVKQPPAPFANPQGAMQTAAPKGPRGAMPGTIEQGIYAGKSGKTIGAKALPSGGAIGQAKMPNQSGQVFGRMGTAHPSKIGGSDLQSKFPRKGNARFYGE